MTSKYDKLIESVFFKHYAEESGSVPFDREELATACNELKIPRIKNLGDIVYSYRFRRDLPGEINKTSPAGCEWIIIGTGIGSYEFRLSRKAKIEPAANRQKIKIPDATPEIVKIYAPANDEQALLTKVRYNRIVDIFMGTACYSIQNHLRTVLNGVGQIEIDEIYLGVAKNGMHYVFPCQAKSPGDKFGIVQVLQDVYFCRSRYPSVICRPVAMQFIDNDSFAILETTIEEENGVLELVIIDEKHYKLVDKNELSIEDIEYYRNMDNSKI